MNKFLLLSFLVVASCVPKTLPPKPTIQKSAVPAITKVQDNTKKLKETVAQQKKIITTQKSEIEESIRLAEELREQMAANTPDAPNEEGTQLIEILHSVKERNLFLEETVENLAGELSFAEMNLIEAKEQAAAKDEESRQWEKSYNALYDEYQKSQDNLQKTKIKAARAEVYRRWIIGIVIAYIAWLIIKNILMVYFPASQFLHRV